MTTRVEMLNRALLRIGADPVLGEDEPGADIYLACYDSVLLTLSVHRWTFFEKTARLVQLAEPPPRQWAYAYQLPAERIGGPLAVYESGSGGVPSHAWDLYGDQLHADMPECWWTGRVLRDPAYWPGDFAQGFELALMSALALSVREDAPLARVLREQAFGSLAENGLGGVVGGAFRRDQASRPSRRIGGGANPFVDVRG